MVASAQLRVQHWTSQVGMNSWFRKFLRQLLVKNPQTKEKVRDAVLLLAQTGIIFAAVGRGHSQEVVLYHVTSWEQGKRSCFLGEAIPGESWWGHCIGEYNAQTTADVKLLFFQKYLRYVISSGRHLTEVSKAQTGSSHDFFFFLGKSGISWSKNPA